jgi:inosine/xanthosine triphosphate pyrophosphatase family protein
LKNILFFSHNQKKIIEVKQIFKNSQVTVDNLNSFKKIKEPKETGNTFESNAKINLNMVKSYSIFPVLLMTQVFVLKL